MGTAEEPSRSAETKFIAWKNKLKEQYEKLLQQRDADLADIPKAVDTSDLREMFSEGPVPVSEVEELLAWLVDKLLICNYLSATEGFLNDKQHLDSFLAKVTFRTKRPLENFQCQLKLCTVIVKALCECGKLDLANFRQKMFALASRTSFGDELCRALGMEPPNADERVQNDWLQNDDVVLKYGLPAAEAKVDSLVEGMAKHGFTMNEISLLNLYPDILFSLDQLRAFISCVPYALELTNAKLRGKYFQLFRQVFTGFTLPEQSQLMQEFFDSYGDIALNRIEAFWNFELNRVLNSMVLQSKKGKRALAYSIAKKLSWFFTVSPKHALLRVVHFMLNVSVSISALCEAVQNLRPIMVYKAKDGVPLVLHTLIHYLQSNELCSMDAEQNWLHIVCRFTLKVRTLETLECWQLLHYIGVSFASKFPNICLRLFDLLFSREHPYWEKACEGVIQRRDTMLMPVIRAVLDLFLWSYHSLSEERSELLQMAVNVFDGLQSIEGVKISTEDIHGLTQNRSVLPLHVQAYLNFVIHKFIPEESPSFPVPACLATIYSLPAEQFDVVPCSHAEGTLFNLDCVVKGTLGMSEFSVALLTQFLTYCDLESLTTNVEMDWRPLRSAVMRYYAESLLCQNVATWKKVLDGTLAFLAAIREAAWSLHVRTAEQQAAICSLEILAPVMITGDTLLSPLYRELQQRTPCIHKYAIVIYDLITRLQTRNPTDEIRVFAMRYLSFYCVFFLDNYASDLCVPLRQVYCALKECSEKAGDKFALRLLKLVSEKIDSIPFI